MRCKSKSNLCRAIGSLSLENGPRKFMISVRVEINRFAGPLRKVLGTNLVQALFKVGFPQL